MKNKKIIAYLTAVFMITTPFSVFAEDNKESLNNAISSAQSEAMPNAPTVISAVEKSGKLTIKWKTVKEANGYALVRINSKTGEYKCVYVNGQSYEWTDYAKKSSGFVYYIKSYVKNGQTKVFSLKTNIKITHQKSVTVPKTPSFKTPNKDKTAIRLKWNTVNCSGYQIFQYDTATKKYKLLKTIKNPKTDNLRISGLKSGTKYTFRIKAFTYDKNKKAVFGKTSPAYSVTTLKDTSKHKIVKKNGITYIDGILIANKTYGLPSSYNPGLTKTTQTAFRKMQQAAWNDGISLWIASGFRSYDYQAQLYQSYVNRDGKAAADRYSARPGYSEHQTGLAIDVNNPSSSFNDTKEAKWLSKNCWKYGFIIRYPQNKENITGYKYESWHVRYVGTSLAKKLTQSGKTLEEYFGITSKYAK